jgi:hypothetical protein
MTALSGGLKYSWLDMQKSTKSSKKVTDSERSRADLQFYGPFVEMFFTFREQSPPTRAPFLP